MKADQAMTFGAEAYLSPDFARAESDRLWAKVWQHACRLEEIPEVGDYVTYEILDDSVLIVRTAPDEVKAYHNVCMHRGRRLVDQDCGHAQQFRCQFHGWRWNLDGENAHVVERADWDGALRSERIRLGEVRHDLWGGWVWINLDPHCTPLLEYLDTVAPMLDPFEFEKMRYRWRQWCYFDCNWKVAIEAFIETYHVEGTHPQLLRYADFYTWSRSAGLHSVHGFAERQHDPEIAANNTIIRAGKGDDPRVTTMEMQREILETVNASTTQTLVDAAARLVAELPEGTPAGEVMAHFIESAKRDDAARGVVWPEIDPEHYGQTGINWHVFPNMSLQHGYTFVLCYRVRPAPGNDPNRCIFETAVLERFPEGQEPETEWVQAAPTQENWRLVLAQDFSNMRQVQRGMKSRGFRGTLPNPKQEEPVVNFHRNLATMVGGDTPKALA